MSTTIVIILRSEMKRLIALLIATLALSLIPHSASASKLEIWEKLQGTNPKGYVLLIRHALAPGAGDPENFQLGDCSTQRNLSEEGRQDARDIGRWIERREIPILRIETSRWCRARQTAQLLGLGPVQANKNLDSLFQRSDVLDALQTQRIRKKIISHRGSKGLLILVGHFVNFSSLVGVGLESGEGVLIRANSRGELKIVGYSPRP